MFCSPLWWGKSTVNPEVWIFHLSSGDRSACWLGEVSPSFPKDQELSLKSSTADNPPSPPHFAAPAKQRKRRQSSTCLHASPRYGIGTTHSPQSQCQHAHGMGSSEGISPGHMSPSSTSPPWAWGQPAEGTARPPHLLFPLPPGDICCWTGIFWEACLSRITQFN